MVNEVTREVPRPKPKGPQAPWDLALGLPRGTPFTTLHPKLFHILSFFGHPGLVRRDYHTKFYIVEAHKLVDLNPNILVRHFQRMYITTDVSTGQKDFLKADCQIYGTIHASAPLPCTRSVL